MMLPMSSLDQGLELTQNLTAGFKELLNSLKLDEVSDTIKQDEVLIMIGTRYYNSLRKKKTRNLRQLSTSVQDYASQPGCIMHSRSN